MLQRLLPLGARRQLRIAQHRQRESRWGLAVDFRQVEAGVALLMVEEVHSPIEESTHVARRVCNYICHVHPLHCMQRTVVGRGVVPFVVVARQLVPWHVLDARRVVSRLSVPLRERPELRLALC